MGREKHSTEKQIQITLDILYAISKETKFYFMQYGKDHLRSLVKNCSTPDVRISLIDAKQMVAEMYSKEDWQDVLKDYEYGIGISKMIGFEDLMDKVAETYKGNEV